MTKITLIPAALVLFAGCGFADILSVNLDTNSFSAQPGETFLVTGILSNNDLSTVDLNDISVSLDGMFVTDTSPFLSGPFTVDPGGQTGDFGLFQFTVTTPYTDPQGPHTGTVTILGGVEGPGGYDATAENILGSADFQVNVTETPEPGSVALFATVIALMFILSRRAFALRGRRRN